MVHRLSLLFVLGCAEPPPICDISPRFIDDDAPQRAVGDVRGALDAFMSWTDFRCLAEVSVTPNAYAGGHRWRAEDGWKISLPTTGSWNDTMTHLCWALLEETDVLAAAESSLFSIPGTSSEEQFIEACRRGPVSHPFRDQAEMCGVPGPSRHEQFMNDHVFVNHTPLEAGELQVESHAPVDVGPVSEQLRYLHDASSGILAWSRSKDADWSVEHHSLEGIEHRFDVPAELDPPGSLTAVDGEQLYWLADAEGTAAWRYDVVTYSPRGLERRVAVAEELRWLTWGRHAIVVGDELFTSSISIYPGAPSVLYGIHVVTGAVREVALPLPDDASVQAGASRFWEDPSVPGTLWVEYGWLRAVQYSDPISITWLSTRLGRVDLATGEWVHLSPEFDRGSGPRLEPFGVRSNGELWGRVSLDDRTTLMATLDADGAYRVASTPCDTSTIHPTALIDGVAYEMDYGGVEIEGRISWTGWSITEP